MLKRRSGRSRRDAGGLRNPSHRFVLQGSLAAFPLGTLLTILEMEKRTGALILSQGTHMPGRGKLYVRDGQVIAARALGAVRAAGRPAVYELLGWQRGRFGFTPGEFHLHDELRTPTARLLLEAAQWADESAGCADLAS